MSAVLEVIGTLLGSAGVVFAVTWAKGFQWFKEWRELKAAAHGHRKIDAEAAQIIANSAVSLIAPLQAQVEDLSRRVAGLERENAATRSRLQVAITYIRALRAWSAAYLPYHAPPEAPRELGIFAA